MPSRNPKDLSPLLQEFWPKLRTEYMTRFPGCAIFLTCTYRSPDEQAAIFAKNAPGHVLTRCDGVKVKSKHNTVPSLAFDVAISHMGVVQWNEEFYKPLGPMIASLGYSDTVRWGGYFSFRDYPHFEAVG